MESATVQRGVPKPLTLRGRARSLSVEALAPWAFAALCLAVVVGFFVRQTYPTYDSYYSLVWGREIMHLHLPTFEAYRAPTEHPLAVGFGALLSIFGHSADRLLLLCTMLSLAALAAGTYRLAKVSFSPLVGAIAAALVVTRFDFDSLAVRGFMDIPFMAMVVWAGALEAARPRRGPPVFVLLAAAGLLRPEGWLLAGLYFLWMSWRASWADRARFAALAAIGPLGWAATDLVVTGDPFFSLHSTQDLAAELGRQKSGSVVRHVLPQFLRETVKTPVYLLAIAGFAIALWRFPVRLAIPAVLFFTGVFTFIATGSAGLSVIVRYLMVPSVMMCLFAAIALGGFTMVRPGSRLRRAWATVAAVAAVAGLVYYSFYPPIPSRFDSELVFRGDVSRSLYSILGKPAVREGLKCGAVSVPTHKLIPDTRWILDRGEHGVVARSDPSRKARARARYGVALFPVGRRNILRTGFAVNTAATTQVPSPGFTRIATDRYFAAYLRCPPGRH